MPSARSPAPHQQPLSLSRMGSTPRAVASGRLLPQPLARLAHPHVPAATCAHGRCPSSSWRMRGSAARAAASSAPSRAASQQCRVSGRRAAGLSPGMHCCLAHAAHARCCRRRAQESSAPAAPHAHLWLFVASRAQDHSVRRRCHTPPSFQALSRRASSLTPPPPPLFPAPLPPPVRPTPITTSTPPPPIPQWPTAWRRSAASRRGRTWGTASVWSRAAAPPPPSCSAPTACCCAC